MSASICLNVNVFFFSFSYSVQTMQNISLRKLYFNLMDLLNGHSLLHSYPVVCVYLCGWLSLYLLDNAPYQPELDTHQHSPQMILELSSPPPLYCSPLGSHHSKIFYWRNHILKNSFNLPVKRSPLSPGHPVYILRNIV